MCVAVAVVDLAFEQAFWSGVDVQISVPSALSIAAALAQIRRILLDLGAPKTDELVCFCGDPVELPPEFMELPHGAKAN